MARVHLAAGDVLDDDQREKLRSVIDAMEEMHGEGHGEGAGHGGMHPEKGADSDETTGGR